MHGGSLARAFVGWFLLLNRVSVNAAIATTVTTPTMEHEGEGSGPQNRGNSSSSIIVRDGGKNLLLRDSEDVSDHCITSADCAFNGECVKEQATSTTQSHEIETHEDDGDGRNYYRNSSIIHDTTTTTTTTTAADIINAIDPEAPGRCDCFAGWKGRTCEVLDLLPVAPHRVGLVLPNHDSSTWGGSVVYHEGDGLYHMFASEILYNCGLYSWTTNSQVIRAISDSPFGPYKKVQVILPPFAHDANIIRAPTGEFVLFVTALEGVKPRDCRQPEKNLTIGESIQERRYLRSFKESSSSNNDDIPPKDTYMLWAPEPGGPWSEPIMVLNSTIYNSDYWKKHNKIAKCDSNLNGIILPSKDGETKQSFLGLWRRCETENLLTIPHALVASDWKNASTYQPIVDHPLFVLAGSGAEDPSNIWTTRTSDMASSDHQVAYHAIFHDEQATRCMLGSCGGQGRHAVSLDGTTWRYASVNAYDRHFSWESSSSSNHTVATTTAARPEDVRSDTRARPHIVLASGIGGGNPLQQTPIALSTGLKETDASGYVYTLVQPLRTSDSTAGG